MLQPMLTVGEAARFLKLKPQTIREWIVAGRVRAKKVGRTYVIPEDEIARLVNPPPPEEKPAPDPERSARIAAMRGTLKGSGVVEALEDIQRRDSEARRRLLDEFKRK